MPTIGRIDFCKSKTAVKSFETADPLTTPADGLVSFGCKPLLAHQRSSDGAVLTEIDQKALAPSIAIAMTIDGTTPPTATDASGTNSSNYDPTDLFPGYAAGLNKVQPLTGTTVSPFPAPVEPKVNLNVRFASRRIVHSSNGIPIFGDPAGAGDIMAILGAGFGSFPSGTNNFVFEGNVDLNGSIRVCSKRWRAFHKYNPIIRMPFTPTFSPLLMAYQGGILYSLGFINTFAANFTGGSMPSPTQLCDGQLTMVLVHPALQTCSGTTFMGDPNVSSINNPGPSLIREYCEFHVGDFIVGNYASNDTVDITLDNVLRPNLIIYADQTVTSVAAFPGGGSLNSITPIQIVPNNPASIYNNSIFSKAFITTLDGTENTFSFSFEGPCGSITTDTKNFFTAAGLTQKPGVHYWWEAYAHIETVPVIP